VKYVVLLVTILATYIVNIVFSRISCWRGILGPKGMKGHINPDGDKGIAEELHLMKK